MNDEKLKNLLMFLTDNQNNNDFGDDEKKIKYLYNELEKSESELPTLDKLEELRKIEVDLEIKYESLYELNNYFDPIYIFIKNKIHDENVKKIREENRRKRGIN